MTDDKKTEIIGIVLSMLVGIAGVFGIQVISGCATTGSADWNVEIVPMEVKNGSI